MLPAEARDLAELRAPARAHLAAPPSRWPEALAAALGLCWFLAIGGWRALPPTAIEWATRDQVQHIMGWLFFRRAGWSLPLGRVDGLAWPTGTTLGFTDANPLVALALRPLSPLLPAEFQYLGLWIAACFALQGWFGARLAGLACERPSWRVLGGVLFALSPPLLGRIGHATLCAHWAILASLHQNLRPLRDAAAARRAQGGAAALAVVLAAVHPYLAFMVLGLGLALAARVALVERLLAPREAAARFGAALLLQALVLALLGYFTSAPSHARGFGKFSTDLLAFVNPGGLSLFLPDLPVLPEQWEGSAYLGVGNLLLVAAAASLRWSRHDEVAGPRVRWPLLAAVVLMAVFALSPSVRLMGREVLDLRLPWRPFQALSGPLRSSGRFVWPLHALVVAGSLLVLGRSSARRPRAALAVVAAGAALQLLDLAPRAAGSQFVGAPWPVASPAWALARGEYDVLALAPAQVVGGPSHCTGAVYGDGDYWVPLARIAYAQRMAVNSAQVARGPPGRLDAGCDAVARDVEQGPLRPRIVYVVHRSWLPLVRARADAACGRLDGYDVCVAASQRDPFRQVLAPDAGVGGDASAPR